MEHQPIEGGTRTMTGPVDMHGYCGALQIRDVRITNEDPQTGKKVTFGNFMVSKWKPTEEEIMTLFHGGSVYLWIRGEGHPVVMVGTDAP